MAGPVAVSSLSTVSTALPRHCYKLGKQDALNISASHVGHSLSPGARFSKAPEKFRTRKFIAKSRTLRLQSCFIHIFLIRKEVHFIQEVSGVYTSPILDTDERKMALRARKVSGAFEKGAPGRFVHSCLVTLSLCSRLMEFRRHSGKSKWVVVLANCL